MTESQVAIITTTSHVETDAIDYRVTEGVASIQLSRPQKLNAMTLQMLEEIITALHTADSDSRVKSIVISGQGRAFSSGWDRTSSNSSSTADDALQIDEMGRRLIETLNATAKPTIARLRGPVVGGGTLLAASCDLRLADTTAYFWLPEPVIGAPVFWSGVSPLVREIGYAQTRFIALTGKKLDSTWASRVGLVHEVHDDEDGLDAGIREITDYLTRTPPAGVRGLKDELRQLSSSLPMHHPHSARMVLRALAAPEFTGM